MNQTLWERICWALFGEWRIVITIGILVLLVAVLFYGASAYILLHFIHKYW